MCFPEADCSACGVVFMLRFVLDPRPRGRQQLIQAYVCVEHGPKWGVGAGSIGGCVDSGCPIVLLSVASRQGVWLSWTWHGWTCHADVRRQGQENAAIPLVLCFQSAEPAPRAGVTRRPLGWDRDGGQGQEEGSNVGGPSVPKTFRAFSTRSAVADGFNRNMRRRPKKAKLCTMCRTRYVVPISPFRTCPGGSTTGI